MSRILLKKKREMNMIVYTPLWKNMKQKGFTTYTLREKHRISGSTIQRLKKNQPMSTSTLDDICKLLNCSLSDIAEYIED